MNDRTPPGEESRNERFLDIAERFGTPTYVYEEAVLRDRIENLRSHLIRIPAQLSYACKANVSVPVLKVILEEGLGIDAVSPAELDLALRIGFQPERILFSANNMTDEEMAFAVERNVLLNIGELSRLDRFGRRYPGSHVCVRLNPQVGAGHHDHVITAGARSKFGIPVEERGDVLEIVRRHDLRLTGLHQHIGSGVLDTAVLGRAVSVMLDAAASFDKLDFINFGGGLGVPYRPDEEALDFDNWEESVSRPLRAFRDLRAGRIAFVFEPGRYLVAEAGSLLVRVNTVKQTTGKSFAGVDSGMNHLARPAIYDAYHGIENLSNPTGDSLRYDVVGNICESADFFARDRLVPEIREGDVLRIADAGAYGIVMASTYNLRPLPAEVWIPQGASGPRLTVERESVGDFLDRIYPEFS